MNQAQHRAATHPRLVAALDRAIAAERARSGGVVTYYSTTRNGLDCSTIVGPCSRDSKHDLRPAQAADMGGRAKSDAAFWRRFAGHIDDPCVEAGHAYGDNNHFELQWDRPGCRGGVVDEGAALGRRALDDLTPAHYAVAGGAALLLVLALR